jgi:NADH:ubiquinone oxidoreductase subunit 6 (subunit J)
VLLLFCGVVVAIVVCFVVVVMQTDKNISGQMEQVNSEKNADYQSIHVTKSIPRE